MAARGKGVKRTKPRTRSRGGRMCRFELHGNNRGKVLSRFRAPICLFVRGENPGTSFVGQRTMNRNNQTKSPHSRAGSRCDRVVLSAVRTTRNYVGP